MNNSSMRIGAVVVAYRSGHTIERCLESLVRDPQLTCVVVDNSGDEETEALATQPKFAGRVKYLLPDKNLGYSGGCNAGVAELRDIDYVAIINPDVELTVNLSEVLAAPSTRGFSIVAGQMRGAAPRYSLNARRLPSVGQELLKALIGSRAYSMNVPAEGGATVQVEQLDGALLVLTTTEWLALGGFDESFELYFEDVDLCRRAMDRGGCGLVGDEWGRHVGGESFRQSGGAAFIALRISRLRYFRKWFGMGGSASAVLITSLEWAVRTLARAGEGQRTRNTAWVRTVQEWRRKGSIWVLPNTRGPVPSQ